MYSKSGLRTGSSRDPPSTRNSPRNDTITINYQDLGRETSFHRQTMLSSSMNALDIHTLPLSARTTDDGGGDDSSTEYEEESISSSDDESFFSYYSIDHLSTILEETDQDLSNEVSRRGSRSRRGTGRSIRSIDSFDDIPPSPPIRSLSRDVEPQLHPRSPTRSALSGRPGSPSTISPSSMHRRSPGSGHSEEGLIPSVSTSGNLRSQASDLDTEDDASCWSCPLNDVSMHRNEQSGNRSHRSERKSVLGLVSVHTGEELALTPSDDEYTFVSCTSGDDMSLVSDLGSSRHTRSVDDSSHHDRATFSLEGMESSEHQTSTGEVNARRGSGFSIDSAAGLLTIPEDGSSDEESHIVRKALDYKETQRRLRFEILRNRTKKRLANQQPPGGSRDVLDPSQRKRNFDLMRQRINALSPIQEDRIIESNDSSLQRLAALKHRLRLERYSGARRRKSFMRSKKLLGKIFGRVTRSNLTESIDSGADNAPQQLGERLARFGGLIRRESFKDNKSAFEKKFDKEVKPLVNPLRRRRSLSPLRRESSFNKSEFVRRMSKSDGQLLINLEDLNLEEDSKDETERSTDDELIVDSKFEQKFKRRQERFGGLRRRNSFKRSQRVLTKKFDKIQARSKEERERFGGLQRMESYKQSRQLFQRPRRLSRKSESLIVTKEEGAVHEEEDPAVDSNEGFSFLSASGSCKPADWSYSLQRSRVRGQLARRKLEQAFKDYYKSSADGTSQIFAPEFDDILSTLEKSPNRLATNPDVRRARKNLQHTVRNQNRAGRV